jgi:hypothetical protein
VILKGGGMLTNTANHKCRSFIVGALFLGPILYSLPAAAGDVSYPVSGVFLPIDPEFPAATFEACLLVRTFGVEAVSKKSVARLIIFDQNKRHDLMGDLATETTIKRIIKLVDGTHHILETFSRSRGGAGDRKKNQYEMKVLDQNTIQIFDGKNVARYAKCVGRRRLSI